MELGDHIYISLFQEGKPPYHHGIYLGNDTVIHYQKDYKNDKRGRIRWVSLKDFKRNASNIIYVKKYFECDSRLIVLQRAKRRLGEKEYNFFYNNCEHFAHYCKTGEHRSHQVESYKTIVGENGVAVTNDMRASLDTVKTSVQNTKDWISKLWKKDDDDNGGNFELI